MAREMDGQVFGARWSKAALVIKLFYLCYVLLVYLGLFVAK